MTDQIVGIIGGSGLGDVLAEHIENGKWYETVTPFGQPSDRILVGEFGGEKVAFLNRHGRGHRFDPSSVPYRANIYALKELGVRVCVGSAAVGSLREEIRPRDIVVVDQVIDKTFKREGSFFTGKAAVHCEMAEPYCGELRGLLVEAAKGIDVCCHDGGTYVCMEGPSFSTRAESLMHRSWGGDLIGMTAMPEAKLAREAQMCFALVAMPTDYDCWKENDNSGDKQALLEEIIGNLNSCTENMIKLLRAVVAMDIEKVGRECCCRNSLEMAIWTRPDAMSDDVAGFIDVLKK